MKKYLAILLALVMVLGLAACAKESAEPAADASAAPVEETEEVLEGADVNLAVLAGPTGIGAVGLMEANDAKETVNNYTFTVASAPDEVVGVLYILEKGETVQSIADLKGKTVYATGQGSNPEYVLEYLLEQNGLTYSLDGSAADVQLQFMASEELTAGMVSGQYDLCMLPVPAVTAVTVQNPDVRVALDLTAEWDKLGVDGKLTQGCIVVTTKFAEEHPDAVKAFLKEYAASIDSVLADPAHAGELCEQYGIVAKAPIATKAIPSCNLCCVTGEDVRPAIEPFFQVMFDANPKSIGGAMPGDDFYFVAK